MGLSFPDHGGDHGEDNSDSQYKEPCDNAATGPHPIVEEMTEEPPVICPCDCVDDDQYGCHKMEDFINELHNVILPQPEAPQHQEHNFANDEEGKGVAVASICAYTPRNNGAYDCSQSKYPHSFGESFRVKAHLQLIC